MSFQPGTLHFGFIVVVSGVDGGVGLGVENSLNNKSFHHKYPVSYSFTLNYESTPF